ncbi:uncharacterized protein LOC134819881 [Bolinopsis microptera]|uniref:uncharacterized protein LOC134819881 n=1 Tax=Bolinopsis microptera TaxID=2820187 RepID=UPI0030799B6C
MGSSHSSSDSRSSNDENHPWIFRDTTFAYLAILSATGFAIFWVTQALFIEDLMQLTGISLVVIGFMFACVRIGKVAGHLLTVPLTTFFPNSIVQMTISGLILFSVMIVLVPFITSPYLLGLILFLLGVTYGVVDSCTVLIIQMLHNSERAYFTNLYYATSSVASFSYSLLAAYIKSHHSESKDRLIWANFINSGVATITALMILTLYIIREKHKYYLINEVVVLQPLKFKGFRHYLFSFLLLSWSAFSSTYCLSAFWNFILLVLQNSTQLDSKQIFILIEAFHGSLLFARILAVPVVVFYENKTVVVGACNAILVSAAICAVFLRDRMFEGLLIILLFYGMGLGLFHQSLLNWLTDHIIITPKTSLPFFLASTSGVVLAPMTVPHLITGELGMVEPIRFIWLVFSFSLSTAVAASILIFIEQLKSDTEVQEIQIMPSVIKLSQHSFSTVAQSQFPDTPDGKHDGGSWSRLSKLSTYTQKLDPTLSFVSSMT